MGWGTDNGSKSNLPISVDKYNLLLSARYVRDLSLKNPIVILIIFIVLTIAILYWFFGTELGAALRATGANGNMARAQGINTNGTKILGLMISNALVALSGSLIAQLDYGSALVNMGQGTIVIGLASVIIGEVIFIRKDRNFAIKLTAIIAGAIIYRTIIACALTFSFLKATDLKIITAIIVSIALALPVIKQNIAERKLRAENSRKLDAELLKAEMGGENIA